jgi:predicted deacylase
MEVCKLDIVTITDNQSGLSEHKPQVFISGTLHGDERIGPHVAFYLIEYLVNNFG